MYLIYNTRFAFYDFDKIHSFSSALSSETIAIDNLGPIAQKLHTYTIFTLLNFIFYKKL